MSTANPVSTNAIYRIDVLERDPLYGFPLKEVQPDGAVWQYDYNLTGDVVALTDPEGGLSGMNREFNPAY